MSQTGAPLAGFYDDRLVALSILIAISASYAALDLGGRVTAARGWIRSAWLAGGAAAMGFGIWSMHFTGMLAFNLPVPVAYHWPTVFLSLLTAIFASAVAFYVVSRKNMGRVEALTGSVFIGLGIAGMHYIGMAAMRLPAACHYNPLFVAVSVVIGILASLTALVFTFDHREDFRGTTVAKAISAAAMGGAISLMHYAGMMSASFIPSTVFPDMSRAVSITSLGFSGVVIGTLVVQGVAIWTSAVDRRFAMQAQELQTSERFRQIADLLKDVLLLSNADLSEVLFVNDAYEAIWGRTVESLYAAPRSWLEGVHPDDRPQVQEALRRLVDGEPLDYVECRVVRSDGSISWVRLRARPVLDSQGHPCRIVGSFHEFTKRKLAEEERRQIEEQYRAVVETATDAVVTIDESSRILFANPATLKLFGYESAELIKRPLMMLMPESLRERHKAGLQRYLATSVRHMNWQGVELIGLRKSGEEFPVEVSFTEVVKQGHRVFTGFIRNITERKRAEEELQQAHERIDSILRSVSDTFILFDRQWRYLYLNDAAIRATRRPLKEVLGRTLWELFPVVVGTELDRQFHRSMDERVNVEFDFHFLQPGIDQWWEIRTYPQPEGLAVFATEVTERKRAEEELERLSGKLLRLQDEARRKIARDLHDSTGQDLAALAMMLDQLRDSVPPGERKSRKLLSECKALADQCVREVRTLSYVLHPPMLDEAGLEHAIRDYVNGFAKRSGVQVELELSPGLGRMAPEVELALFRVVQEALTNIQRHSGSEQAKVRIHRNSHLTLEISDLGQGVSASAPRGKEQPPSQGVGIPSMQERVKLIGGRLDVHFSSQGTTVRVTLPLEGN